MFADVLVVASLAGLLWWWHCRSRQARHVREAGFVPLLGYDDLPPIGAFDPLPDEHQLDAYVQAGLRQLDSYLTGRDTIA